MNSKFPCGVENAVFSLLFSAIATCQYLEAKSRVVKYVAPFKEPEWNRSMEGDKHHGVRLSLWKSMQNLQLPSGSQIITGEDHGLVLGCMTLWSNIRSTSLTIMLSRPLEFYAGVGG